MFHIYDKPTFLYILKSLKLNPSQINLHLIFFFKTHQKLQNLILIISPSTPTPKQLPTSNRIYILT
jgi:hypothetical protein